MKRAIERIAGILAGVESIILPGLFVAVGPFIWFYRLMRANQTGQAVTVVLFWLASMSVVGYEVRRRAITALSLFVFLVWLVVLACVFGDHLA
jgi:hypothetical protein